MLYRLLSIVIFGGVLLAGCTAEDASPQRGETAPDHADHDASGAQGARAYELAPGDTTTISGTLIDTHCYADDHANVSTDHERPQGLVPGCAALCARQGFPVGVLVDGAPDEAVWVLVTAPAVLADYMAETVRVTGEVRSQGVLIPHRIALQRGDEWTFIL